jgi:hypothetical protein
MTARTFQTRVSSQDFLAALDRAYRGRAIQRDALGRRSALPSEIAHLLTQSTPNPSDSRDLAVGAGFTPSSEPNVSEG